MGICRRGDTKVLPSVTRVSRDSASSHRIPFIFGMMLLNSRWWDNQSHSQSRRVQLKSSLNFSTIAHSHVTSWTRRWLRPLQEVLRWSHQEPQSASRPSKDPVIFLLTRTLSTFQARRSQGWNHHLSAQRMTHSSSWVIALPTWLSFWLKKEPKKKVLHPSYYQRLSNYFFQIRTAYPIMKFCTGILLFY